MTGPRVLLMQLSQRTSGKGTAYLSGWLGKASVVAFEAEEPDRHGNRQWNVYLSAPEPRGTEARGETPCQSEGVSAARVDVKSCDIARTAAKGPAGHVERDAGWRGPSAYRRPERAQRPPAAPHEPFPDDDIPF